MADLDHCQEAIPLCPGLLLYKNASTPMLPL